MFHFDLIDLRLFVQLGVTRSLRAAAANIGLAPSAASARLSNLEVRSNTKLVQRSNRGLTLTPAGDALLFHARNVIRETEDLISDFELYRVRGGRRVKIAANPIATKEMLAGMLSGYLAVNADIHLDLSEMLSDAVVRAVLGDYADIGIITANNGKVEALETLPFGTTPLVVVTSRDHPLAGRGPIRLTELLQNDIIDFPEANPIAALIRQAANAAGSFVRTRVRVTTVDSMCVLAASGTGVGVAPQTSALRAAKSADAVVIPLVEDVSVETRLCARSFASLPAAAKHFMRALLASTADPGVMAAGAAALANGAGGARGE